MVLSFTHTCVWDLCGHYAPQFHLNSVYGPYMSSPPIRNVECLQFFSFVSLSFSLSLLKLTKKGEIWNCACSIPFTKLHMYCEMERRNCCVFYSKIYDTNIRQQALALTLNLQGRVEGFSCFQDIPPFTPAYTPSVVTSNLSFASFV